MSLIQRSSGATSGATTAWYSLPLVRPGSAAFITFVVQADQNGTLDIQALWFAGAEATAADWWTYNTSSEQVAVTAGSPARITITGGAPVMRILYTPVAPATVSHAEAFYTSFTR